MTPAQLPPVINTTRPLSIKYTLTRCDILRWQFYQLVRNRIIIVFPSIISAALTWQALTTPELSPRSVIFKVFYSFIIVALVYTFVFAITIGLTICSVMFKKFRGFLGEHELEIRDEGLLERTDVNESLNRWAGFHKIVTTGQYLYIYVTDNNVHIVPKRCFASERDLKEFRDAMQKHTNVTLVR